MSKAETVHEILPQEKNLLVTDNRATLDENFKKMRRAVWGN